MIEAIEGERDTCLHPGIADNLLSAALFALERKFIGILLTQHILGSCFPDRMYHQYVTIDQEQEKNRFPSVRSLPRAKWLLYRSQSTDKEFRVSCCAKRAIARNELELPAITDWLKSHALRK
jgi:hypothetical protein